MIKNIEQGIATPYVRYNPSKENPYEIGYCTVDSSGCITGKCMLSITTTNFSFQFDYRDTLLEDTNFSITPDGYIRFWTDNMQYYLLWKIEDKIGYIIAVRK